ncbi:MAG: cytochrome c oxidase subunit II [Micrococcales bacterium]|nr:MAG: cytochrome c oxidase subunit II [Micrococcales bacterium]PIE26919.1 MAG: cytochrome c oxidase subunit II [Micrococcales bacterium]
MKAFLIAGGTSLLLAGCSTEQVRRGLLPGYTDQEVTNHSGRIMNLWVGTWSAALVIGAAVWGVMFWCLAVYRRRHVDEPVPPQLRYHVPIETLFTVTPIFMVLTLFFFTARDMAIITDVSGEPDTQVEIVGKQWAWDFNYLEGNVYDATVQVDLESASPDLEDQDIPTLYLPVNENVEIILKSQDVAHSFWVPAFLYKEDLIPGRTNVMHVRPEREGIYPGKCAELCGEFHSEMVLNVKVVPRAEYEEHMQELRKAGNTGSLPADLGRAKEQPKQLSGGKN